MIKTFAEKETEKLFGRTFSKKLPQNIQTTARMKRIRYMRFKSIGLQDLRVPPGNRLEKLSGDREGQHSIRIDDQWRICFTWRQGNAYDVEIVDYH